MFNPRNEVPSPELCIRLNDLGFPQDRDWLVWVNCDDLSQDCNLGKKILAKEDKYVLTIGWEILFDAEVIKAPTIHEMWKWLPRCIKEDRKPYFWQVSDHAISYYDFEYKDVFNCVYDNLIDGIAKMLIWLVENEYINLKGGKDDF